MTFHSYFQLFMKSFVCQMFDQIFITHQYTLSNCWCVRYENLENKNTKVVINNISHVKVCNEITIRKAPKKYEVRYDRHANYETTSFFDLGSYFTRISGFFKTEIIKTSILKLMQHCFIKSYKLSSCSIKIHIYYNWKLIVFNGILNDNI